jgi:hypothetical protein
MRRIGWQAVEGLAGSNGTEKIFPFADAPLFASMQAPGR